MKYFMSMWSPALNRQRNFIMNLKSARFYFRDWYSNILEEKVMFSRGGLLPKPNTRSLYIWGEKITDQELFKRRLAGTLDQETLEE